jgi:enoyl-CoA hydratase
MSSTVDYELPAPGIARIVLNRPEKRNAQSRRMTYELNEAFDQAAQDDSVKVVILAARGPDFCSGHDLADTSIGEPFPTVGTSAGFGRPGAEGFMAYEEEVYLNMCWRWRNIPKPTIAAVQGRAIAGALMLIWVCDLVVASADATFSDITVALGVNGVEYFAHPWELGPRKAKELLFTGAAITAEEAQRAGMINTVVAPDDLEGAALTLAEVIATKPSFALKLAKESVNQTLDTQGFWASLRSAFGLHSLAHSHNREQFHLPIDPSGLRQRGPERSQAADPTAP